MARIIFNTIVFASAISWANCECMLKAVVVDADFTKPKFNISINEIPLVATSLNGSTSDFEIKMEDTLPSFSNLNVAFDGDMQVLYAMEPKRSHPPRDSANKIYSYIITIVKKPPPKKEYTVYSNPSDIRFVFSKSEFKTPHSLSTDTGQIDLVLHIAQLERKAARTPVQCIKDIPIIFHEINNLHSMIKCSTHPGKLRWVF